MVLVCNFVWIQAQVDGCRITADFDELYRYGKSKEALEVWDEYMNNCKSKTLTEFSKGEYVLRYQLDNAKDTDNAKMLKKLLDYYAEKQRLFPDQSRSYYSKKAVTLNQYSTVTDVELMKLFAEALLKKDQFDDPMALKLYFDTFTRVITAQKEIDTNAFIEGYLKVKTLAKQNLSLFPGKADEFENFIQYVNSNPLVNKLITCDVYANFIQNNLDARSGDYELLLGITMDMFEKCSESPLLLKMAQYTYDAKVTALSAYYLGVCKFRKEALEGAEPYLLASVDLEDDKVVKSENASKIAMMVLSVDPSKSAKFMQKAIESDPKNPNNYLMMAAIYEASIPFCELKGVQSDAVFYLASKIVLESAKADPKYSVAAQKKSNELKGKMKSIAPKGKKQTVELGCWFNQTVTW